MNREIFTMPSAQDVPLDRVDAEEIELQESVKGVRSLIREMLLTEAAYTPERAAKEGFIFRASKTKMRNGGWLIVCIGVEDSFLAGEMRISIPFPSKSCLGAYEVNLSQSRVDGLGPLLYDIAMELAGPAGLMSDRGIVSPEARKVWQYYHDRRPEVDHLQLDSVPGTITPYFEEDDCYQQSAREEREDWKESPLSKVYRKRGTPTIDRLRDLGIIEIK